MKTLHFITVAIILTLLLLGGTAVTASAKDGSGYTEISGVVKDKTNKEKAGLCECIYSRYEYRYHH